jgi:hypothetical protein
MTAPRFLFCAHCDYWAPSSDERFCPEGHLLKKPDGSRSLSQIKYQTKTTGAHCAVCGSPQRMHEDKPREHCHICGARFG